MSETLFQRDIANLLMCASARIDRIAEHLVYEPIGLSAVSFKILAIVAHLESVQPRQLVEALGSTKSNVTQRLKYLERQGYVERQEPAIGRDQRTVNFRLTDSGRDLIKQASEQIAHKKLNLENEFSQTEREQFLKLLEKLNNQVLIAFEKHL